MKLLAIGLLAAGALADLGGDVAATEYPLMNLGWLENLATTAVVSISDKVEDFVETHHIKEKDIKKKWKKLLKKYEAGKKEIWDEMVEKKKEMEKEAETWTEEMIALKKEKWDEMVQQKKDEKPVLGQDGHGVRQEKPVLGQDGHGVRQPVLGQDGHGVRQPVLGQDGHGVRREKHMLGERGHGQRREKHMLGADGHGQKQVKFGADDHGIMHQDEKVPTRPGTTPTVRTRPTKGNRGKRGRKERVKAVHYE